MKEKRVDIYLAEAGFCQMIFLGFGGAFASEIIKNDRNMSIVLSTGVMAIMSFTIILRLYRKAKQLSNKTKK